MFGLRPLPIESRCAVEARLQVRPVAWQMLAQPPCGQVGHYSTLPRSIRDRNLGSISETLFESELFGHKKGAFTDAKKEKPGRFEIASGGTIFFDEIGNLTFPLQSKLLTVIERREVIRHSVA